MDITKILERVRKLLAIANDTRANPNEAAAAAAQAENIMRKFNLDNADVLLKRVQSGEEEFDTVNVSAFMKRDNSKSDHVQKRTPKYAGWLAIRVAKLNNCEVRYSWDAARGSVVQFCGYKSDAQVAGWMFDYLLGVMINDLRAWQKAATRSKAESNSYREGFILAVCDLLSAQKRAQDAEMKASATGTALVVAKTTAIAQHFGNFKYGKGSGAAMSDRGAFAAGREAGSKVDVGRRAVGATAGATTLRLAA